MDWGCVLRLLEVSQVDDDPSRFPFQYGPRYDWTVPEQSVLLGAYFWGYLVTQLPGGLLSEWFGGRHVIGYALALSGVATCLVPISATVSFWLVFVVRVMTGALGVSQLVRSNIGPRVTWYQN